MVLLLVCCLERRPCHDTSEALRKGHVPFSPRPRRSISSCRIWMKVRVRQRLKCMIKTSGRRKRRAMFVSAASSPSEGLIKVGVEEFERRGEETLEPFALADAEWRVVLHRLAGVPRKWPTEE
jgi:hypothetical protein